MTPTIRQAILTSYATTLHQLVALRQSPEANSPRVRRAIQFRLALAAFKRQALLTSHQTMGTK